MRANSRHVLLVGAFLLAAPSAQAHMMPQQTVTLNVRGSAAFVALSIPVSALRDWDRNGDGRMTRQELAASQAAVRRQLDAGIVVRAGRDAGRRDLILPNVELDEGDSLAVRGGTHLLVLVRQSFTAAPVDVTLRLSLFGANAAERRFIVKATATGMPEVAILTPNDSSHAFFRPIPALVARWIAALRSALHFNRFA
ncbi:MAG: hypothetical protein V4813_15630 [Gemmatimonadota bacterium]